MPTPRLLAAMPQTTACNEKHEHVAKAESQVIDAAENWARAIEAMAQADEAGKETGSAEEALHQARIALYDAVMTWRASRRPADFTGLKKPKARRRSNIVDLLVRSEDGEPGTRAGRGSSAE